MFYNFVKCLNLFNLIDRNGKSFFNKTYSSWWLPNVLQNWNRAIINCLCPHCAKPTVSCVQFYITRFRARSGAHVFCEHFSRVNVSAGYVGGQPMEPFPSVTFRTIRNIGVWRAVEENKNRIKTYKYLQMIARWTYWSNISCKTNRRRSSISTTAGLSPEWAWVLCRNPLSRHSDNLPNTFETIIFTVFFIFFFCQLVGEFSLLLTIVLARREWLPVRSVLFPSLGPLWTLTRIRIARRIAAK